MDKNILFSKVNKIRLSGVIAEVEDVIQQFVCSLIQRITEGEYLKIRHEDIIISQKVKAKRINSLLWEILVESD